MDINGKCNRDHLFSPWQQANLAYNLHQFWHWHSASQLSSAEGQDFWMHYRDTLPDLAESASGPDAGLLWLLPLCPL